jgi:hypothetical protein
MDLKDESKGVEREDNKSGQSKVDVKSEHATLSRNHPISEFLRLQKGQVTSISKEEFASRYDAFCKENGYENDGSLSVESKERAEEYKSEPLPSREDKYQGLLKKIVLKFTTLSESGSDAPSFTVDTSGARIGREQSNEVSVPSDVKLAPINHASIEYIDGMLYLFANLFVFLCSLCYIFVMSLRSLLFAR